MPHPRAPQELRPLKAQAHARKAQRRHKQVFCGLMCLTALLLTAILAALYGVAQPGLARLAPWLDYAVLALCCGLALVFLLLPCMQLAIQLYLGKTLPLTKELRALTIKFFLPLMELAGRAFKLSKDRVRHAFIYTNNALVQAEGRVYTPENILVLAPHCLQNHRCNYRLTHNINNCRGCGNCAVAGLKAMAETYGVYVALATGGSIARRLVLERRPKCLVAVACERDLTSGIQDVAPLPVWGVFNTRPFGPCIDTDVAIPEVESALRQLLGLPPLDLSLDLSQDLSLGLSMNKDLIDHDF